MRNSRTPVLITERANIPEVETYRAGKIVVDDPHAVATAIDTLLDHSNAVLEDMGRQARKLIAERFSRAVVLPQMLELYERVAGVAAAKRGEVASAQVDLG